jgi:hypothetical protein
LRVRASPLAPLIKPNSYSTFLSPTLLTKSP